MESTDRNIRILSAPETNFQLNTACIPEGGGDVAFINNTPDKLMIESWNWDFGDPASGEDNTSADIDPVHFYFDAGTRSIRLTTTSFDGCIDTYVLDTVIGIQPVADFTWKSDCYTKMTPVLNS